MRRRVFIPAVLILAAAAAVLLGACKANDTLVNVGAVSKPGQKSGGSASSGTTEVHADGVRRIDPGQLREWLESGSAAVYDTRAKAAYDAEHIRGALSMPFDEVSQRAGELPKDKTLVFYCT